MQPRRAVPLVLAVAGLLAVAALASHGRPLTGSTGTGPTPRFFDYVFTTIALIVIAIAVVFVASIVGTKWDKPQGRPAFGLWQFVVSLVGGPGVGLAPAPLAPPLQRQAAQPEREAGEARAQHRPSGTVPDRAPQRAPALGRDRDRRRAPRRRRRRSVREPEGEAR